MSLLCLLFGKSTTKETTRTSHKTKISLSLIFYFFHGHARVVSFVSFFKIGGLHSMARNPQKLAEIHDLDFTEIDERDEIDGDRQLVSIWCLTHKKYESHWIDISRPALKWRR